MPVCVNVIKLLLAASLLLLVACKEQNRDFGFVINGVETRAAGQQLKIVLEQKITLSQDARIALTNGIPLHLEVRAELETDGDSRSIARRFEIRYMPLSDHYQLSSQQPAFVRTYPRLRHALADLSAVELNMPLQDVTAGVYELQTRSWLDKRKLPPPMRLPAWFSPNWQHDSGWQSWPVSVNTPT